MATEDKKKKTLFNKIVDSFSGKKGTEAERVAAEEAEQKAARDAELKAMAEKHAAEAAKKRGEEAEKKLQEMEAAKKREEMLARQKEETERIKEEMKEAAEAAKPKFIAEHTVKSDETLSHIALKYYGSATRPYWEVIHAANLETVPNANIIRPGQVLNIPELPEELKKK